MAEQQPTPSEPFPMCVSAMPKTNIDDEFIMLSLAVGDRSIEDLYRDLGIPGAELSVRLRQLQCVGRVTVHLGFYYPRSAGAAVVPVRESAGDAADAT